MPTPLPIDPFIPEIVAQVREHRCVVVTAAPGAGKTTRVAPALAADGPLILLQPRRVAARSIARRIAHEQGWTLGREVGWQVRFERQFSADTSVLLATEGILTARLQQDPILSAFRTVIFDEFHERSIHSDVGVALARHAWLARDDLRLVVMSATLDSGAVSAFLGGSPVVAVPGVLHPLSVSYTPGSSITAAAASALTQTEGNVLCFLTGAREIRRATAELSAAVGNAAEVLPLHGSLSAQEQDAALAEGGRRRIILATNIAETSLTVPGVAAVVDSGLHKVARYDPGRAIDSLEVERISQDSADQRAGRAARLGPGAVWRLWAAADRLRPHREAEIDRIDLSGPALDILAWGGDPARFEWFQPPRPESIEAALALLQQLGAIEEGRLTALGCRMQSLPVHPRLARILISAGGAREAALACALLSERDFIPAAAGPVATTTSDLLSAIEREGGVPAHAERVARELQRLAGAGRRTIDDGGFRRALLSGYPDRVGKRRQPGAPRVLLASGHGAVVGPPSGVRDGEFLLALDAIAAPRGEQGEALIRLASVVDREWLVPTRWTSEHYLDRETGTVRAVERAWYGAIVLTERPLKPDADEAARILADAYLARPRSTEDEQLLRRLQFAGLEADAASLARAATHGRFALDDVSLDNALPPRVRGQVDRLAPTRLALPSNRSTHITYEDGGGISAAVKLQELFGLAETPRVGPRREPVLMHLLAPNGRPVQTTRDLRSFWERTYPEVRKELRGRYPKHSWPTDPWTATPAARTKGSEEVQKGFRRVQKRLKF